MKSASELLEEEQEDVNTDLNKTNSRTLNKWEGQASWAGVWFGKGAFWNLKQSNNSDSRPQSGHWLACFFLPPNEWNSARTHPKIQDPLWKEHVTDR